MKFQAKIRKIGNSYGIIIPKDVITKLKKDVITFEILEDVITEDVITKEGSWLDRKISSI